MSLEYRYPGPSTTKLLKEVNNRISDLEWNGDPAGELENLYSRRAVLEQMIKAGELYAPNF